MDNKIRTNIPLQDITVEDYQSYFSGTKPPTRKSVLDKSHNEGIQPKALNFYSDNNNVKKYSIDVLREILREGVYKKKGYRRRELERYENDSFH